MNGEKGSLLEGGSRVPLIANWKGVTPAGKTLDDLVDFSDMFATFAVVGGAKLPEGVTLDSRSFAPQLHGEKGAPREWVFEQLGQGWYVREQGFKLTNSGTLFDMAEAPFVEKPVPVEGQSDAAAAARLRLQEVLAKLNPTSPDEKPGKTRRKKRRAAAEAAKPTETIPAKPAEEAVPAKPDSPASAAPAKRNRAAVVKKKDSDGDGKLTREEFLKDQPDPKQAPDRFTRFDLDKDGVLSREEFAERGAKP